MSSWGDLQAGLEKIADMAPLTERERELVLAVLPDCSGLEEMGEKANAGFEALFPEESDDG